MSGGTSNTSVHSPVHSHSDDSTPSLSLFPSFPLSPGCLAISTIFSHAQTVVVCGSCSVMLCQPTGGKARLTEGCSFRKKQE